MMKHVIYYICTNSQLLHAMSIAAGQREEQADLILLNIPRLSHELCAFAETSGYFHAVLRFTPDETPGKAKYKKLTEGASYWKAVRQQLAPLGGQAYQKLYIGGFWGYSLLIYRFFAGYSRDLSLALIDDGMASYMGLEALTQCVMGPSWQSLVKRIMWYPGIYGRARAALMELWLVCPEACREQHEITLCRIPRNQALSDRIEQLYQDQENLTLYRNSRAVLFLQPDMKENQALTEQLASMLAEAFGKDRLIVRPHPDDPAPWIRQKGFVADEAGIPYEILVSQVDWQDKLLVGRSTSCLMLPEFIQGHKPSMIYTYMMYRREQDESALNRTIRHFIRYFGTENRIFIPETVNELKQIIQSMGDKSK